MNDNPNLGKHPAEDDSDEIIEAQAQQQQQPQAPILQAPAPGGNLLDNNQVGDYQMLPAYDMVGNWDSTLLDLIQGWGGQQEQLCNMMGTRGDNQVAVAVAT